MARSGYLRIENEKEVIEGSVKQKGHENWVEVIAVDHKIAVPVDDHTGQIFGRRQHHPFVILKALDKSTPLLYSTMCEGINIKTATIEFMKVSPKGGEELFFTYKLEGAKIIKVETVMENVKDKTKDSLPNMERVYLSYRKITWAFAEGGLEKSDDWEDRTSA